MRNHALALSGLTLPEIGNVKLREVKLLVGDEHRHRDGPVPGGDSVHQPVQLVHAGLGIKQSEASIKIM